MHIFSSQNTEFSYARGAAPLQPPPGGQPPGPCECLVQALGLPASLTVA